MSDKNDAKFNDDVKTIDEGELKDFQVKGCQMADPKSQFRYFWRVLEWMMLLNFTAFWYILWPFGIFLVHRYIFLISWLGDFTKKKQSELRNVCKSHGISRYARVRALVAFEATIHRFLVECSMKRSADI
jgi:hypothetical protein